jgi:glycosyltransferase involved in cell wall biosynthesis
VDWAGRHIAVLNWRDLEHPQAGGAEVFAERIAEQFVLRGAQVTLVVGRGPGQSPAGGRNGFAIRRGGGTFGVYPAALWWLLRHRRSVDAVLDCQNGIPFFSPLAVRRGTPVVQVIHHVHQRQFGLFFSRTVAMVGRQLEARGARLVYGRRPSASVSPSTRDEVRELLRLPGARFVVPNGTELPESPTVATRSDRPTIVCVGRLVAHKRVELLVRAAAKVAAEFPDLRVHMVGTGPDELRLRALTAELGLAPDVLTWHGRLAARERDELVASAWMTVNPTGGEGWGISVMEAASYGVPALAYDVPGLRDSIVPSATGWLVERDGELASAIVEALQELANPEISKSYAQACRAWARRFTWARSAELLWALLGAEAQRLGLPKPRQRRLDSASVVVDLHGLGDPEGGFRATDLVYAEGGRSRLVLYGCGLSDAEQALARVYGCDVNDGRQACIRPAGVADYLTAATGSPG